MNASYVVLMESMSVKIVGMSFLLRTINWDVYISVKCAMRGLISGNIGWAITFSRFNTQSKRLAQSWSFYQ